MRFQRFRRFLLILVIIFSFSGGMVIAPRPAHAGFLTSIEMWAIETWKNIEDWAIWAAEKLHLTSLSAAEITADKYNVNGLDPTPMALGFPLDGVVGTAAVPFINPDPRCQIIDSERKIQLCDVLPRQFLMNQQKARQDAMFAASLETQLTRTMDGTVMGNFSTQQSRDKAMMGVDSIGREEVPCPTATRNITRTAARVVTQLRTEMAIQRQLSRWGGDPQDKETGFGVQNSFSERVQTRISRGYCNPAENSNANEAMCASEEANGDLINLDINPEVINGRDTLDEGEDLKNKFNIAHAEAYLNNLFPVVFTPLTKEQIKSHSGVIDEILSLRTSYMAQLATLASPFGRAVRDRQPIPGIDQQAYEGYIAALKSALGKDKDSTLDDAVVKLFLGRDIKQNALSQRAMERIHFREANIDPNGLIDASKLSVLNSGNTQVLSAIKLMDIVVLLYDIRDEMRLNNQMLGTLGSLLSRERYEKIEGLASGAGS